MLNVDSDSKLVHIADGYSSTTPKMAAAEI